MYGTSPVPYTYTYLISDRNKWVTCAQGRENGDNYVLTSTYLWTRSATHTRVKSFTSVSTPILHTYTYHTLPATNPFKTGFIVPGKQLMRNPE